MLEGSSLIKKAQIEKIDTIYFGGGTPSLMPTKVLSVSHAINLFVTSKKPKTTNSPIHEQVIHLEIFQNTH